MFVKVNSVPLIEIDSNHVIMLELAEAENLQLKLTLTTGHQPLFSFDKENKKEVLELVDLLKTRDQLIRALTYDMDNQGLSIDEKDYSC